MSSTSTAGIARSSTTTDEPRIEPVSGRRHRTDLLVVASFLVAAVVVTGGLWLDPGQRALEHNSADQFFFEWVLRYTAHAIAHGSNPFFTPLMNAPLGVNLGSNTAVTVLGVLGAPITLLAGAATTFAVMLTLSVALTATSWYWLFTRHTDLSRAAAVFASAFCGFAPGIISHANGHLNFTAEFLIPILIWRVIQMMRLSPSRSAGSGPLAPVREGAILGLIVAAQYSIGAELLFFTAFGLALFGLARFALGRLAHEHSRLPRPQFSGFAVAGVVASGLLAYPIWMQFFGPQAYHGTGFGRISAAENLLSFGAYPFGSVAGVLGGWGKLTSNIAEENTFFGPACFALAILAAARLCRRGTRTSRQLGLIETRALCLAGIVIGILSLGPRLHVANVPTNIMLPWAALARLPLFDAALPGRLALLLTPILAYLLAVTFDDFRIARATLPVEGRARPTRFVILIAVLAFLPIAPVPLETGARSGLPRFFTSGDWRAYLPPGRTIVSVPPSSGGSPDAQRWQTRTDFAFAIDGGYFLGPGTDQRSHVGPVPTPTYALLKSVTETGIVPRVTAAERAAASADLRYWHAGLIVLPDPRSGIGDAWSQYYPAIKQVATALFGPGRHVDDVWLWTPAS
jgi:hypothetical protein